MIDVSKTKKYWLMVESHIQELLNQSSEAIDLESVRNVQHYLNHSEYEMAFEGLFIELIDADVKIDPDKTDEYFNLGLELGLDEDSVFDGNFWEKFKIFLNKI